MAEMSWMTEFAIGSLAGGQIARENARQTLELANHLRQRREAIAQDQTIDALIVQYNHLSDNFNALAAAAEQLQHEADTAAQENARLRQALAAADEHARRAEAHEGEIRKALDHANAKIGLMEDLAVDHRSEINRLLIENSQLKRR